MKQQQTAQTVPFVPVNPCSSHKLSAAEFKARSALATKQQLAMYAIVNLFDVHHPPSCSNRSILMLCHRLEASDDFQAWRQHHPLNTNKPAHMLLTLALAATAVLGAVWMLHATPSPTPEPIDPLPLHPPLLFSNISLEQTLLPTITTCPAPMPVPAGLLDAARQAMLLIVAVVGMSTAANLIARLLHKPLPSPAPTPTLEHKPEPLYGQLLILQAELAKKARELQTAHARCIELDAAAAVLREENKDLQDTADRNLEAKVCDDALYFCMHSRLVASHLCTMCLPCTIPRSVACRGAAA